MRQDPARVQVVTCRRTARRVGRRRSSTSDANVDGRNFPIYMTRGKYPHLPSPLFRPRSAWRPLNRVVKFQRGVADMRRTVHMARCQPCELSMSTGELASGASAHAEK